MKYVLALVLVTLIGGGLCINTWGQSAPPVAVVPARPSPSRYEPKIPARAVTYQRAARALGLTGLAWKLTGMMLFLRLGLATRAKDAVYRRLHLPEPTGNAPPPFRALLAFFALYTAWMAVWLLPRDIAFLLLERHFGFSRQTPITFVADFLLGALFDLVWVPVLFGGFWLIFRAGRVWWIWAWAGLLPLLLLQIVLQPVVIAPAFNRFTPLEAGPVRDRILDLAGRSGVTGARVFVEDTDRRTEHVNAYVTGLGPTTRIVLNNTALRKLPEDELFGMMAHEIGHYVEGHRWAGVIGGMAGGGAFLWLLSRLIPRWERRAGKGAGGLVALPALMLTISIFLVLQAPVENAISRTMERRADAFALRLTGNADALARLFAGFAERDYADPDPPALLQFWFGSHPTLKERIAAVGH